MVISAPLVNENVAIICPELPQIKPTNREFHNVLAMPVLSVPIFFAESAVIPFDNIDFEAEMPLSISSVWFIGWSLSP